MTKLSICTLFRWIAAIVLINVALINVAAAGISWNRYSSGVFDRAKKNHKTVLIYGYMNSCPFCRMMDSKTFNDKENVKLVQEHYIPIRIDVERDQALAHQFQIYQTPTVVFIAPDQTMLGSVTGYVDPGVFRNSLKSYISR